MNASFAQEYLTQNRLMSKEKQKVARLRNCSFIRRGLGKQTCSLKIGLGTLRAPGLESGRNVESAAVTVVRSLPDIDWVALHRQNVLETARRRDGGRMSISHEHSPRVSKMVPSLCRTSKLSHAEDDIQNFHKLLAKNCNGHTHWLQRLVRLLRLGDLES